MLKRVRYFFVKELIQTLRDKRMRMTLIIPPIFQLIIRGVFLKANGLDILWPQMLALGTIGYTHDSFEFSSIPKKTEVRGVKESRGQGFKGLRK
jgi:hypothetical protein